MGPLPLNTPPHPPLLPPSARSLRLGARGHPGTLLWPCPFVKGNAVRPTLQCHRRSARPVVRNSWSPPIKGRIQRLTPEGYQPRPQRAQSAITCMLQEPRCPPPPPPSAQCPVLLHTVHAPGAHCTMRTSLHLPPLPRPPPPLGPDASAPLLGPRFPCRPMPGPTPSVLCLLC